MLTLLSLLNQEEGQGGVAWIVILALIVVALVILVCCLSQGVG